ncbi:hypothetical protein PAPYR_12829 [Paratrimastix pyriformis]|uniref:Uncharacterized protein n=1 Tax=Paratrimastix pyriformis TaxID=342808 RepID=A0ABQ8U197_9EUKA|nr:hypothetical protein PAPYR_12829 [Paratrimastix pyriformis]
MQDSEVRIHDDGKEKAISVLKSLVVKFKESRNFVGPILAKQQQLVNILPAMLDSDDTLVKGIILAIDLLTGEFDAPVKDEFEEIKKSKKLHESRILHSVDESEILQEAKKRSRSRSRSRTPTGRRSRVEEPVEEHAEEADTQATGLTDDLIEMELHK